MKTTPDSAGTHTDATVPPATMRAVVHSRFGNPADALELAKISTPTLASDEVLVRVAASGVAIGDWLTVAGQPYIARPMFGIRTPKQRIAGFELAGTVVAVGDEVTRFAVGDEVFGFAEGSLAEYAAVSQDSLAGKPAGISMKQAAAVPISAIAALQALRDSGKVTEGQSVLVVGASGAVGTYAVQIAKALGAEVTGVAGTGNIEMVRSIGADHVVDYRSEDITDSARRYDMIIDIAGNRPIAKLRSVLAPSGTLVIVGGSGGPVTMGFGRTVWAMASNFFTRQNLTGFFAKNTRDDLEALAGLLDARDIVPVIDRTYSLDETVEALEYVGARHTRGKTVITV
jgi:NADPH:quinone reductase-like Zn-dependent oxidoreductase